MGVGECVTGSGECMARSGERVARSGVCGRELGSVWMGVGECVTGSGGVCNWEWGSVWLGVGECVDGSGGVCNWEWGVRKMKKGFQIHLFAHGAPTPVFFFIMCSKIVCILQYSFSLSASLCMHTQYVRICALCPVL